MPTARQVNWAKFRVFTVALLAFIILSVIFYLLSGGTLLQKKATLYLYVSDATGIGSGSPVRVDGIDVGKVNSVALSGSGQPTRIVRISMTVEREWLPAIPSDSYAQLSSDTLIGDKFVDISSGARRTAIRPNGEIQYRENPDILKRLDLTQFRKQLSAVDDLLTQIEQGQGLLGQFIQGNGMYDEWRKLLRASQAAMDAVAARDGKLGSLVYSDAEYQRLRQPFLDIDQSLARLQSGQGQWGPLLRDDAQYQQFAAALGDLRQSLGEISGSPLFQSEEDFNHWSQGFGNMIRAVDDFNATGPMATSEVYETLTGMTIELQKTMKDFHANPRKYMRMKVF